MHCYICFTYLVLVCSGRPARERRSLFRDVIESLRARAQLPAAPGHLAPPGDVGGLSPNALAHGYDTAAADYDDEPDARLHQLDDLDFLPRRNDRLEMPTLKYRFPKNINLNDTNEDRESPKEEIVLFINAPDDDGEETTTPKTKKTKRPKPAIKNKNKTKTDEDDQDNVNAEAEQRPVSNTMSGQSQIGNRDSQTVVKPTVIVNFRGSVSHRESDIRLERREYNDTKMGTPQNIFNINQEIKLESAHPSLGSTGGAKRVPGKVKQDIKINAEGKATVEEDMMMCETSSRDEDMGRSERRGGVLRIVLAV